MNRPKFIVDNNVGRLAVWLRVLGYDAAFINPVEDSQLLEIAERDKRVILTRDTGIMRRRLITSGRLAAHLVKGDDWRMQLAQVMKEFNLNASGQFSRCLRCNIGLEPREKEMARPHVPPFIYRTQSEFFVCPSCLRHYWQGSHCARMARAAEHISQYRSLLAGRA